MEFRAGSVPVEKGSAGEGNRRLDNKVESERRKRAVPQRLSRPWP